MVAKGEDDKPTTVPELILETYDDVKRFLEALNLRKIKQSTKQKMDDARSHIEVGSASDLLKNERCILHYKGN
jgi:hypothetical protein